MSSEGSVARLRESIVDETCAFGVAGSRSFIQHSGYCPASVLGLRTAPADAMRRASTALSPTVG